jgi:two-component system LytT family response regulator
MINALIVDDEPYCCEVLVTLIEKYCPQVNILSSCKSGEEALEKIHQQHPSLVFLDVEMPGMNGFELLGKLPVVDFDLVFTTSYDQYALKAFRFSAIDYLLKPIDRMELQRAIQKVESRSQGFITGQLEILLQKIHQPAILIKKIALPTMEGLQMIAVDDIVSCASDSNYTIVTLKGKQKMVVSRTLKEIEELVEDFAFVRVHHSFLVNLNEINKYVKGEGGYLVMSDGVIIDVSRSKKENLLKKLLHNKD